MKKKIAVLALGLSPLLVGWIKEFIRQYFYSKSLRIWPLFLFLAFWALLGFMSEDILDDMRASIFFLNLPALIDLTLLAFQLIPGGFWANPIGVWSHRFLFPAADLFVDTWQPPMYPAFAADAILPYLLGFLSMLLASFIGARTRRYGRTEHGF